MSEDAAGEGGADAVDPRAEVRVVAGRLSDDELAAVAVAVAALNAVSRAEARERLLAEGAQRGTDGWGDAVHRIPSAHTGRDHAGDAAWAFSHR